MEISNKPQCLEGFEHKVFKLENELRVLIIRSDAVDMAAACLTVGAGSLHEQDDRLGMAHFCEHMCFLGTAKYPNEDEYMLYISGNGGSCNATTDLMETNYFFTIKPDRLEQALDRFAPFFYCPKFAPNCVGREVNAVQSEHNRYMQFDSWRHRAILCHTSNPNHPLQKFRVGTYESLMRLEDHQNDKEIAEKSLRDAVMQFYGKFYSANIMTLCVLTNQSMAEAEKLITDKFSQIENKQTTNNYMSIIHDANIPVFRPEDRRRKILVVPNTDTIKHVDFVFALPMQCDKWETHPERFVAHVVGYEGEGSLLSSLKQAGLATGLNASVAVDRVGVCAFSIRIELTDIGLNDIQSVGTALFTFLRLLMDVVAANGEELKAQFQEYTQLCEVAYKFQSLARPMNLVQKLGGRLLYYPPQYCYVATEVPLRFEPSDILEVMEHMTLDNMNVFATGVKFEPFCNQLEKYYVIKYEVEDLNAEWVEAWQHAYSSKEDIVDRARILHLFLPRNNPFVPKDLQVRPPIDKDQELGVLIPRAFDTKNGVNAYYRHDAKFGLPKVVLSCNLILACLQLNRDEFLDVINASEECCPFWKVPDSNVKRLSDCGYVARTTLVDLVTSSLQETLKEFSYDAQMAGLQYDVSLISPTGRCHQALGVRIFGYNDTLPVLFEEVIRRLAELELPKDKFTIALDKKIKAQSKFVMNCDAFVNAEVNLYCMFLPHVVSPLRRLSLLEKITPEIFYDVLGKSGAQLDPKHLFESFHLLGLVEGNLSEDNACHQYLDLIKELMISKLCKQELQMTQESAFLMDYCVDSRAVVDKLDLYADENIISMGKKVDVVESSMKKTGLVLHLETWNPQMKSGATVMTIQMGHPTHKSAAFLTMFQSYYGPRFFNDLRTQQQLGYICSIRLCTIGGSSGLSFICQSARPTSYCLARIEEFLCKHFVWDNASKQLKLTEIDQQGYDQLKSGVIARFSEEPKKLMDQHLEHFIEVESHRYDFKRRERKVEFLRGEESTLNEFKDWISRNIVFNTHVVSCIDPPIEEDAASENGFNDRWLSHWEHVDDRQWFMLKDEMSLHRAVWTRVAGSEAPKFYVKHFDSDTPDGIGMTARKY